MTQSNMLDSVSAICYLGMDLFLGTTHGEVFLISKGDLNNRTAVFVDKFRRDVVDICCTKTSSGCEVAIVVRGLVHDPERGDMESTEAFLVAKGTVVSMGFHVSKLLSSRCVMQYDNQLFSVYFPQLPGLRACYSLEWFYGTNVYDFDGEHCLAINRSMTSSTIYTIDLTSKKSIDECDTFLFSGPYFSKLKAEDAQRTVQNGGTFGEFLNLGSVGMFNMDDFDDENIRNEERFNRLLDPSLVLKVHDPRTYLDFVRIVKRENNESIVISGGRDHKVVVSTLFSHQVLATFPMDVSPRCGLYDGSRLFYVGHDSGVFNIDLMSNSFDMYSSIPLATRITKLHMSPDRRKIAAFSFNDNAIFSLACPDLSVLAVEDYKERIEDFCITNEGTVIAYSDTGALYY